MRKQDKREEVMTDDVQADGYYDEDAGSDEELDLSFLDESDEE